jgi:hypothetical protein
MYATVWGRLQAVKPLVQVRHSLGYVGGVWASHGSTKPYACMCAARKANPGAKLLPLLH